MSFKEHVCLLNPKGENDFPGRFRNEIYFVEDLSRQSIPYSYTSNFSLKSIFKGEEHYVVNGTRKKIGEQQYLFVNNQSEICRTSSFGTSLTVFLEPELLQECHRALTSRGECLLEYPLREGKKCPELFDEVMHGNTNLLLDLKFRLKIFPDLFIPVDYYYELAQCFLLKQNSILGQMNQLGRDKFATRKELFKRVNVARNYLEDTLLEPFDLDRLAQEASLSKFQLIRDFKSAFGVTPHRYFILKKMALALKMINSRPEPSLNEVAFKLSYPSLSSFSRQFKQVYGLSPTAMRRSD